MTAAIVLAAGQSLRFGAANKLLALVDGVPLAAHIAGGLSRLPLTQRLAVVSDEAVSALFEAAGFRIVRNTAPADGLGASLTLGRAALGPANRVLICLADMPDVSENHLRRLLAVATDDIVASSAPGHRGPPLVVPRPTLMAARLVGDAGLRDLLADARFVETAPAELRDIDRPADLASR